MENLGLGAGLAAIAFWGFVAAVVVAGIWDGIRKREAQHETVRRLIESGQTIDQELLEKLSLVSNSSGGRPDRDLMLTGLWMLPVGPGLAVLALFLGSIAPEAETALFGVAALVICMGIGFIAAGKFVERKFSANGDSAE